MEQRILASLISSQKPLTSWQTWSCNSRESHFVSTILTTFWPFALKNHYPAGVQVVKHILGIGQSGGSIHILELSWHYPWTPSRWRHISQQTNYRELGSWLAAGYKSKSHEMWDSFTCRSITTCHKDCLEWQLPSFMNCTFTLDWTEFRSDLCWWESWKPGMA